MANAAQLANLKVGNEGCYPKPGPLLRVSTYLPEALNEPAIDSPTMAQAIAKRLVAHAAAGSAQHLNILLDRTEGPVVQKVEVTNVNMVQHVALIISEFVASNEAEFKALQAAHPEGIQQAAVARLTELLKQA